MNLRPTSTSNEGRATAVPDDLSASLQPLLRVEDLRVSFPDTRGVYVSPVRGVSFELYPREIVGLVGESGSGKSLTARSCLRLVRSPGKITARELKFDGIDLLAAREEYVRSLRSERIALVAQDPLTSFHPLLRIGNQMEHALKDHGKRRGQRQETIIEAIRSVGLPDPARQARRYPHELSGGMRQRAMIALSLINEPELVIADEPTTALDTTVQSQVLQLLASLSRERQLGVLLLTHNLGIVAGICTRVLVMYSGRIVESGTTQELFSNPQHPYTKALLDAVPRLEHPVRRASTRIAGSPPSPWDRPAGCAFNSRCAYRVERCEHDDPPLALTPTGRLSACWVSQTDGGLQAGEPRVAEAVLPTITTRVASVAERAAESLPLFAVQNLTRHFRTGVWGSHQVVHALDDINLEILRGESLGIVGESGSGKSTLVRLLANLDRPTSGQITFRGWDLASREKTEMRAFRRTVQIVFQDPYSSLDPRYTVAQSIQEALRVHNICARSEENGRIRTLLERVRLSTRLADRYPREMSGGERQRVSIARALAAQPEVLLADEPVSSLDVSIQAQIIELLEELQAQDNFTLVIVAHDLALVRQTCQRVVTLYLGQIVEDASVGRYFEKCLHPYSLALIRATPDPDNIGALPVPLAVGDAPSPVDPPSGCRFHPRCFNAQEKCAGESPSLKYVKEGGRLACFFPVSEEQEATLGRRRASSAEASLRDC